MNKVLRLIPRNTNVIRDSLSGYLMNKVLRQKGDRKSPFAPFEWLPDE
uniref:Uncharacterized protein n=1 Tax=uncultured Thiotrichaceae bacterium TaxID=298394 RepID=A0A6S6U961_9GAMM|nr:MAG: Unknown protein [uncultured Thiotrichaceae bacterium]